MLSKGYESTEVDCRTWLHVPSGTHWSTSSDTHQVVEIQIETSTKMYTLFLIYWNTLSVRPSVCKLMIWTAYFNRIKLMIWTICISGTEPET